MAKLVKVIKLQIMGGSATPAPPVGPVLSQAGINMQDFINQFNSATEDKRGQVVPVHISVYDDKSFKFQLKSAPASNLILEKTKIKKGSGLPHKEKVGKITQAQLEEIAGIKMEDLNANDIKAAAKIIAGTARSMGVEVSG